MNLAYIDEILIAWMHRYGLTLLRFAIGVVFVWFGALKILGISPVTQLVAETYSFLPPGFLLFLGVWEVAIGIGLIGKIALRTTLALLWLQMLGTFTSLLLNPAVFFINSNFFLLTTEGEFVIKNIVFIAASIVIGGFEGSSKKTVQ